LNQPEALAESPDLNDDEEAEVSSISGSEDGEMTGSSEESDEHLAELLSSPQHRSHYWKKLYKPDPHPKRLPDDSRRLAGGLMLDRHRNQKQGMTSRRKPKPAGGPGVQGGSSMPVHIVYPSPGYV